MLGMRKATKKASVTGPAPKASATTMSRTKPSTRLARVATPMEPRAPTTWRSMAETPLALSEGGLTLQSPRASGMMHRGSSPSAMEDVRGEHEVGHEADAPE